jgi:hypothetical protein
MLINHFNELLKTGLSKASVHHLTVFGTFAESVRDLTICSEHLLSHVVNQPPFHILITTSSEPSIASLLLLLLLL